MGLHQELGATTTVTTPELPGAEGHLNVILHGLFALVQGTDQITAYLPHMGSEHLYKVGNWLAETTLAEHADFELQGVDPGTDRLNPEYNITLGKVNISGHGHENHSIYATLRLPYRKRSHRSGALPSTEMGLEATAQGR